MRLPDFSVCLQAQAGIMPLKGKCIPRVQRVVLIRLCSYRPDLAVGAVACRKSMFFQKKCLFSIPIPFRTLCWLCFVQSLVCPYFGILAENPFPRERGYITGATAPRPCRGLRPKARTLWLLAKSFARCKTNKASNVRHPIFI